MSTQNKQPQSRNILELPTDLFMALTSVGMKSMNLDDLSTVLNAPERPRSCACIAGKHDAPPAVIHLPDGRG